MNETRGIDLSHWQHPKDATIDYAKVQADAYAFAWLKASQGVNYADPWFTTDAQGFAAVGMLVGGYHFYDFEVGAPSDQAQHYRASIAGTHLNLGHALDVEGKGPTGGSDASVADDVHKCLVEGSFDVLYTTRAWLATLEPFGAPWGRRVWLAYPNHKAQIEGVEFIQTRQDVVPGIKGKVDIDLRWHDEPVPQPVPSDIANQATISVIHRTLIEGSHGEEVRFLQHLLNFQIFAIKTDGQFGPMTAAVLRKVQKEKRLLVDGVCGPKTWAALLAG